MKSYTIKSKSCQNGCNLSVNQDKYLLRYPSQVWKKFPKTLHSEFSHNLAFIYTQFLASLTLGNLTYAFPPPQLFHMFMYEFLYSLSALKLEFPEAKYTSIDLLKKIYNSDYALRFKGIPKSISPVKALKLHPRSVIMPFSFGKDSLLTFALAKELQYQVHPIFFLEPTTPFQNKHKLKHAKKFMEKFHQNIDFQSNGFGKLRESDGLLWGWDLLIYQYALMLIPYSYAYQANYIVWSHEHSLNEYIVDNNDLKLNHFHEQSGPSMQRLNLMYRSLYLNTQSISWLEPIHEMIILRILHHRYPEIGKFEISCDAENKRDNNWCGKCEECTRINIFMHAIGCNPESIGLPDDLLSGKYATSYKIFTEDLPDNPKFLPVSLGERLLAFYFAYRRGIHGQVIDLFKKTLLPYVEKNYAYLIKEYLTIHDAYTLDSHMLTNIIPIYKKEISQLKKEII